MKQPILVIVFLLILSACGKSDETRQQERNITKKDDHQNIIEEQELLFQEIALKSINEKQVFLVSDLIEKIDGKYEYDKLHRSLIMEINNQVYKLISGIPVIEQSGIYLPIDDVELLVNEEGIYLPVKFLEKVLGFNAKITNESAIFQWEKDIVTTSRDHQESNKYEEMTVEEMIDYLSFLQSPIEDAQVSTIKNHLPGARRAYRNGFHEGIDWYPYASGQHISTVTPVYAMAQGIVVRADHDYNEYPSPDERNNDLALTAELGETPLYIFDRLRGRQVWVQYEKGVMIRFAHLDAIAEDLHVGKKVSESTIIGYVGNSGTSGAVNNDGTQLHLHKDILIYGELFWKPFTLEEIKTIVEEVFS